MASLRRFIPFAVATVFYLVVSVVAYGSVGPFTRSKLPTCACGDVTYSVWFVGWTAHAVAHGLNPLFSSALNYPFGVNVAANPSSPILEFLATPITLIAGPVAAFNLLMHLALASSALAMFWVLTRLGIRPSAAGLGGLLYGFSAYQQSHGSLWLNLSFVGLVPLLLLTFERLWRAPERPSRLGIALGLIAGAQYLISSEVLVDAGLIVLIALLSVAVVRPAVVRAAWPDLRRGLVVALAVFFVVVAAPVAYLLFGSQHYNGPGYPVATLSGLSNDLLGPVAPTRYQLFDPATWLAGANRSLASSPAESGIYLGLPLLAVVLVCAWWLRRRRLVVLSGWLALVAFVLSLGPSLHVDGHPTHLWLPFDLVTRTPLLQMEVPARYELFVQLFASLLLASLVDEILGRRSRALTVAPEAPDRGGLLRRSRHLLLASSLTLLVLAPLVPRWPIESAPVDAPKLISSAEIAHIPPGSALLAYPYPSFQDDHAMLWQAISGFRFDLIGGYAYTPLRNEPRNLNGGGGGFVPRTLDPPTIEALFTDGYGLAPGAPFPGNDLSLERSFLSRYHVSTLVLDPVGQNPGRVSSYLIRALRTQPIDVGGLEIWYHVQQDLNWVHRSASARRVRPLTGFSSDQT